MSARLEIFVDDEDVSFRHLIFVIICHVTHLAIHNYTYTRTQTIIDTDRQTETHTHTETQIMDDQVVVISAVNNDIRSLRHGYITVHRNTTC